MDAPSCDPECSLDLRYLCRVLSYMSLDTLGFPRFAALYSCFPPMIVFIKAAQTFGGIISVVWVLSSPLLMLWLHVPSFRQILRMWKGVRDAECGWLEIVESWEGRRVASVTQKVRLPDSTGAAATTATLPEGAVATPVIGLYLAILAPLRGRVELWRMRHGPCVRIVPAPAGAKLLTSRPSLADSAEGDSADGGSKRRHTQALTSCYLLSGGAGKEDGSETTTTSTTKLRLTPLVVEEDDLADLPSR